ncbi:MAG: LamG-like jellyroll fold domain-containing protein [Pirellulaceae bacterium]|nr:DUF4457 domain-containing protein [Planctomycetales bacterium]
MRKRSRRLLVLAWFVSSVAWSLSAQADLVGHWTFDNGTASDSSGFGNNGFELGTPLPEYSTDVPLQLGGGQSLSFIGDATHFEQRVEVLTNATLDIAGAITMAAWVNPTGSGWDAIMAKSPLDGSGSNHAGSFEFRIENGGRRLQFLHQQGGVDDTVGYSSTGTVNNGTWSHVAVTAVDSGEVNFYINGALAGTSVHNGNFGFFTSSPLYIGNRGDFANLGTPFDGAIDDVRLYNEALTATQIQDLFGPPLEEYPGLTGVRARASSEYLPDGRLAVNAVNNNGIQGKTHGTSPGGAMWLTDGVDAAPEFNIDLGSVHTVDQLRVWNYNENANATCCLDRGVKTADIYVAGADGVFGAAPVISGQSFARAPGATEDFSEVISLGGVQARYIKIDVTENHGDASFTGLSEVKVTGSVVAELAPIPAIISQVSSDLGGFERGSAHLVDGSGLLYADAHSVNPDGSMWLNQGTFGGGNDVEPEITFDFGSEQNIDRMKIWNYNEYRPDLPDRLEELLGRGVKQTDILVAGEDGVFTTLFQGLELARAPEGGDGLDFSETIDFGGVKARYVKLDILSNYNGRDFTDPFGDDGLANFAGLSEVQFFATVGGTALPGDYNGNGSVDAADYTVWKDNFGSTSDLAADGNGNGVIDAADYTVWKDNFGSTAAVAQATVTPEPGTMLCVLQVLLLGAGAVRRRRVQ